MTLVSCGLMADEKIKPSVTVEIGPGCSLRGMKRKQPSFFGNVIESAVAIVTHQRHGIFPVFAPPSATQYQQVRMTVIVVVRASHVQTAHFSQ